MRRRAWVSTALFGVLLSLGCRSDSTAPDAALVGTYVLELVDGLELPQYLGDENGVTFDVTAGAITLKGDRTCDFSHTLLLRTEGEPTVRVDADPCTWTVSSGAVTLRFPDDSTVTGLFDKGLLYFAFFDLLFVYRR